MKLLGGNSHSEAKGQDELSTKSHYFTGGDPARWRTGVPNYSRIRYQNVYPSIDVVYYGSQQSLEYDFVVAPGGNPDDIRLRFESGKDTLRKSARRDRFPLEISSCTRKRARLSRRRLSRIRKSMAPEKRS